MRLPKPTSRWPDIAALTVAALTVLAALTVVAAEPSPKTSFATENAAAMTRMMKGMDVKPSGNVDLDFARMMIAHHQGAIDMAAAEVRYGRNERLRRLAQEIIIEQGQEIELMQRVIDRELLRTDAPAQAARVTKP